MFFKDVHFSDNQLIANAFYLKKAEKFKKNLPDISRWEHPNISSCDSKKSYCFIPNDFNQMPMFKA